MRVLYVCTVSLCVCTLISSCVCVRPLRVNTRKQIVTTKDSYVRALWNQILCLTFLIIIYKIASTDLYIQYPYLPKLYDLGLSSVGFRSLVAHIRCQ